MALLPFVLEPQVPPDKKMAYREPYSYKLESVNSQRRSSHRQFLAGQCPWSRFQWGRSQPS